MKWVLIAIALYVLSVFVPLYCVFGQEDASQQLSTGQRLAIQIISNLRQAKLLNMQLESESQRSSEKSQGLELMLRNSENKSVQLEESLEKSENLAKQLGNLVDDQQRLYKKSLNKWKFLFFGLIGLLVAYNILKAYLRIRFGIRLW